MLRCYGHYGNISRDKRRKLTLYEAIPCIVESDEGTKKYRKHWTKLIQKIYMRTP